MAQVLVLYKTPQSTAAFDKYYFDKHAPIAKKIPGLRKYLVSQDSVGTPTGPSGIYFVAMLEFADMAAIQRAFASAEGQAAAGDLPNFASGGANLLLFETRELKPKTDNAKGRLITAYKTPSDTATFDRGYFEHHVPMVVRIPGLRGYVVSQGPVAAPTGPSGVHQVTILDFDDLVAIRKAFASPEGQAASTHIRTFAPAGAEMLFFDAREI